MVLQNWHPQRAIVPWHSEQSDGYVQDGEFHRPIYHRCHNCYHLKTIFEHGNQVQGRGTDDKGRERELCAECQRLIDNGCC